LIDLSLKSFVIKALYLPYVCHRNAPRSSILRY